MKQDSTNRYSDSDPDEVLEKWIQQRREQVPELPKSFCREVMEALAPPKTRSAFAWSQWLAKVAVLIGSAVMGIARSYAAIHLLFQIA